MYSADTTLAQPFCGLGLFGAIVGGILGLAIAVFNIASVWRIYAKAGKPGWASLVPIYRTLVLLDITRKPWWWFFLFFVPFVNLVIFIQVYLALAKAFGKGAGFAVGLLFLSIVFFPILGFGKAQYQASQ